MAYSPTHVLELDDLEAWQVYLATIPEERARAELGIGTPAGNLLVARALLDYLDEIFAGGCYHPDFESLGGYPGLQFMRDQAKSTINWLEMVQLRYPTWQ